MMVALALPVAALERSAGKTVTESRIGVAANMEVESLKAWALAVLQLQDTQIKNIASCSTQRKFWNGTVCVTPVYTMNSPVVTTRNVGLPVSWRYSHKACTKKTWGVCTRHDNFCVSYCTLPTRANYAVNPGTNSIVIDNYVCSGGGQTRNVGNGGC